MVVSNGKQTFAVTVMRNNDEDGWEIVDEDTESRVGGAGPDDRSGHLTK